MTKANTVTAKREKAMEERLVLHSKLPSALKDSSAFMGEVKKAFKTDREREAYEAGFRHAWTALAAIVTKGR